jgi:transmembrane sensor
VRVSRVGDPADVRILGPGEVWSATLGASAAPPPASATEEDANVAVDASSAASAAPSSVAVPSVIAPASAKELWAQAEAARASKRFQDEAVALNTLRLRHRSDPRAALAAFELGRLRQDTLHDSVGAAAAFADAIALAPNGPFREDAEARRVEALDSGGRREACIEAKEAFLARYPGGIHRQRVSVMCGGR